MEALSLRKVMRMGLCWRQELPLFMGAGESSTPCPGENEEGFKLAVQVLPSFKGHIVLKAATGDAPGQDMWCSRLHAGSISHPMSHLVLCRPSYIYIPYKNNVGAAPRGVR